MAASKRLLPLIFMPTCRLTSTFLRLVRELWPARSVNARPGLIEGLPANVWLDENRHVEQMTWAPGHPGAKAPPPATEAFHTIVDANRAPEDAELADTLDAIAKGRGPVAAITITMLVVAATGDFQPWLQDRRNRRAIPHRLENVGYVQVRNGAAGDGLWRVRGKRQVIYARQGLSASDRLKQYVTSSRGGQWDQ
jgi:hypothetical protein